MSFMVINALSYTLHTIYHDIDTTTLVFDVLFYFYFFLILIYRKLHCIQKNVQIYLSIYIFQNKVKVSSSKNIFGTPM